MAGELRTCGNSACGAPFNPNRPHQRFCCSDCRRRAWAAKHANPPENAFSQARRPTRDGKGTRIYVTAKELDLLERAVVKQAYAMQGVEVPLPEVPDFVLRLRQKLGRAAGRVG